ncbi:MAG: vWA domain-containing protein, partial [Gemmataceae bacterium]
RRAGGRTEVSFTILMEPDGADAEGWQTGVALDASASMTKAYGRGFTGTVPDAAAADYERRGLLKVERTDGRQFRRFSSAAWEDAVKRGFLVPTPNDVEPLARDFISYLAGSLDEDGGTTVIYWACGDGGAFEVVGDFTADQVRKLSFAGPKGHALGKGTRLLPAVKYFVDRFKDAKRGMYVFLTDGKLDDLEEVKAYTVKLCKAIAAGRRNAVKCVLVGVGDQVEEGQMEELDDLDSGTDVDVWDHKIAKEMRGLVEIFAEVVDENRIIAPSARILDASGAVVARFDDGLPAKVSFTMPAASGWFELEVGGRKVRQPVKG